MACFHCLYEAMHLQRYLYTMFMDFHEIWEYPPVPERYDTIDQYLSDVRTKPTWVSDGLPPMKEVLAA